MIRRPPRSTLFPYTNALPISSSSPRGGPGSAGTAANWPGWAATTREGRRRDRKSTRLNSSHLVISYAVFCLKKKKKKHRHRLEETHGHNKMDKQSDGSDNRLD